MNFLIVRQPIFDSSDHIAGYELLARGTDNSDEDERALVDAVLGDGSRRLADGNLAFVATSRGMLLSGGLEALDPTAAVLQIPPDVIGDADVLAACRALVDAGYALALDHFIFTEEARDLLELATIVKYDVAGAGREFLAYQLAQVRPFNVQALAENVEHRTEHADLAELGFSLFQGILFARVENVTRSDLNVEHLRTLKVMKLVRDLDVTEHQLEEEFRVDPGLSYKLLRMVNSAAAGGRGVRSIMHALRLLGREALNRWLSLLLVKPARTGAVDGEIVLATLTRARFCELLAPQGNRPLADGSLFMMGLLSALSVYGGVPTDQICSELELAPEISAALDRRSGHYGSALRLVEAYESGDWDGLEDACGELGVDAAVTGDLYLDALSWAQQSARTVNEMDEADAPSQVA